MYCIGRLRVWFAGIATALLLLSGVANADLTDSLIAHWPMDGDFEDSQGTNHGTFMGTDDPVFDDGILGQGIALDGIDQYVEIANEANFDFIDQDFSISAWFTVEEFTTNWQALIAKGEGNRWRVHRRGGENIMTWNGGNADVPAQDNFDINDGEWHHFVGVSIAGEEVQMYMDGELVSVGPAPTVENNDMPVMIGENPDARNRNWFGMVDDVGIWERALTEDDVAEIWNNGDGLQLPSNGIVPPLYVGGEDTIGVEIRAGSLTNRVYEGSPSPNSPGWGVRLAADSGVTIGSHTVAEEVLDNAIAEGEVDFEGYDAVDLGGGEGTFLDTEAYPNGVDVGDTSMEDFAIRAEAEVVIPAGTYTIGLGSDDGGQITIPGVEFEETLNSASGDSESIRFEGNRGHGWTVGTFTVEEELSTVIITSMHERGGGDSMEIAIIDEALVEGADPNNGWELLADGTFGWQVSHDENPLVLVAADVSGSVPNARTWQVDVNGDTGESDAFDVDDGGEGFNTIIDVDGITIEVKPTGNVANGQAFRVVDADTVVGTPVITSTDGQNWAYNNGFVCLGSCPNIGGGDYNGDGVVDVQDIDAQAVAMQTPNDNLETFDENGDGTVDFADRNIWLKNYAVNGQGAWVGDADLNGFFDSSDFVTVFTIGKYETGENATWGEGDWSGDGLFSSADFVAAFTDGGYNQGAVTATAAVPEPASAGLALIGMLSLMGIRRRS